MGVTPQAKQHHGVFQTYFVDELLEFPAFIGAVALPDDDKPGRAMSSYILTKSPDREGEVLLQGNPAHASHYGLLGTYSEFRPAGRSNLRVESEALYVDAVSQRQEVLPTEEVAAGIFGARDPVGRPAPPDPDERRIAHTMAEPIRAAVEMTV